MKAAWTWVAIAAGSARAAVAGVRQLADLDGARDVARAASQRVAAKSAATAARHAATGRRGPHAAHLHPGHGERGA